MSIADLIQAAEFIERRDRGNLNFLCLTCQSSAVAHVNMAPAIYAFDNQLILTRWQCCLLQRPSTATRPRGPVSAARAGPRPRSRREAGEQCTDILTYVIRAVSPSREPVTPRTVTYCIFSVPGRLITNWKRTGQWMFCCLSGAVWLCDVTWGE